MRSKIFKIVSVIVIACSLHGCYEAFKDSEEFKRARETKAMSFLKKYQTVKILEHLLHTFFYIKLQIEQLLSIE